MLEKLTCIAAKGAALAALGVVAVRAQPLPCRAASGGVLSSNPAPRSCKPETRTAGADLGQKPDSATELATFAGGCFWCVESAFDDLPGVISAISGYTGGPETDPSYREVSSGQTGHLEAVQVRYDPAVISYAQLLETFWRQIDPTDDGGQFADRGRQYRTAIFVHDDEQRRIAEQSILTLERQPGLAHAVATQIRPAAIFYPAETYHQDYHKKNPLRYQAYRAGSGRESYVQKFWRDRPSVVDVGAPPGLGTYRKPDPQSLRKKLTALQFHVTQEGGTEPAFANAYHDNYRAGLYVDVVSGEPLFSSTDKFDSGSGWPSFTRPLAGVDIVENTDTTQGMKRVELRSPLADSHLGHVFEDGPEPTGRRYCINSASLRFVAVDQLEKQGYGAYRFLFDPHSR